MLTSSFCQSYLKSGSWSCFDAPILYYHCAQFRIALKIYRAFGVCPPTTNENAGSKKKKNILRCLEHIWKTSSNTPKVNTSW